MKMKLLAPLLMMLGIGAASASVTLSTQFGEATNVSGALVPDGTLWILVVDTNNDSTFAGGFGLNSSLGVGGANTTFTAGQSLSIGNVLGGDTIFAMGGFNGNAGGTPGLTADTLLLNLGENGLAANRNFAFYWFPGATYAGGNSATIGNQVGGIHQGADAGASLDAMVIPADGNTVAPGAATNEYGGSVADSRFQAVQLIPEPSTALLGAIGALGLLRRRR